MLHQWSLIRKSVQRFSGKIMLDQLEHDPEKCVAVFRQDHAPPIMGACRPTRGLFAMTLIDPASRSLEHWREGVATRMLVSAETGATQLCMFEQWIAPGAGAPTHVHPVEEVLTVLSGEAEIWIEDWRMTVKPGQSALVPAGKRHGFRNPGTEELHIHAILAAPVFEAMPEGAAEMTRRWGPR
jgi:mannose-6-phosphate isomerase-like protein (cupin superfamily)